jgi:predicted O-methyltransferase YrrM
MIEFYKNNDMKEYFEFLENFVWATVAVDKSHAMLLYGMITSHKPDTILELGIGSGFITKTILYAIKYNGKGNLTSVDNWNDWSGKEPNHIQELRNMGVNIIAPIDEEIFIRENKNKYDVIIVDGNHRHGGEWADKVLEMLNPNGFLFAHDVEHPNYPTLKNYQILANKFGYSNYTFSKSSRDDEYCWRGWIMINKNK